MVQKDTVKTDWVSGGRVLTVKTDGSIMTEGTQESQTAA